MKMYHLTVCSLFNTVQQMLQSHSIALCQWEYIDLHYLSHETISVHITVNLEVGIGS